MLFDNINFLLVERGAPPLTEEEFFILTPPDLWDVVRQLGHSFEDLNTVNYRERFFMQKRNEIKLVVLDVDGVLTDGGLYFTSNGEDSKKFNVKDGMAITKAIERGVEFGIISASSRSKVVEIRAEMLGIQNVYVGKTPKIEILESWLYAKGISYENVAYIGDDINDIEILEKVGFSATPSDAVRAAKRSANVVLRTKGGKGCVRELIEGYILQEPLY